MLKPVIYNTLFYFSIIKYILTKIGPLESEVLIFSIYFNTKYSIPTIESPFNALYLLYYNLRCYVAIKCYISTTISLYQ